ncbi:MAG: hypothetical protein RIK87_22320 [Fuerstiella sp.]
MTLQHHPSGDYSFVPGIAPYSCGVVSDPGFEIVHVTFTDMVSWQEGFRRVESFLASEQRPKTALCAMSLRSPVPFTFEGFSRFNAEYASVLKDWGVFADGTNPVARTNVVPELVPPPQPSLYGFAYTRPCSADLPPTFVVAGAGELPEGVLNRDGIVALGNLTAEGIVCKTSFVMGLMQERLRKLGVGWDSVTTTNVYTIHPADDAVRQIVNPAIEAAGIHGITWHYTRPPIQDIEFEMDVRGIRTERML